MHDITRLDDGVHCIIDGIPDYFYRLCITERPFLPVPERQTNVQEVTGRMGAYYEHYSYNDMTIKLSFNYLEEVIEYKAFKQEFPLIRHWLNHGTQLQFTDEPNVYYLIRSVVFDGDVINDMVEYGEFSVTLTLAPFGRFNEDSPIELPIGTNKRITTPFYNGSFEPSYPTFLVTTTSDFRISLTWDDGTNYSLAITAPDTVTRAYTVDCFRRTISYVNQANGNTILIGSYSFERNGFPMAGVGRNLLTIANTKSGVDNITKGRLWRNMLI